MVNKYRADNFTALKQLFQNKNNGYGPYIYLPIDAKNGLNTREKLNALLKGYVESGIIGIIPYCYKNFGIQALSKEYFNVYELVCEIAQSFSLEIGYLDDTYIMREYLANLEKEQRDKAICKILNKYEYTCVEKQSFHKKLHTGGTLMSLTAVNDDDLTILDLRDNIVNGELVWEVPVGNWNVEEYVCEPDCESNYIDLLDYSECLNYVSQTFGLLLNKVNLQSSNTPVSLFLYRNVMYAGRNRRMWHPSFNDYFEKWFGFDPAPFYPLLYRDFGDFGKRYVSLLMSARARILIEGYLKSVSDFCQNHEIFCTGYAAESKTTACSWLIGDAQMIHKYASAPGVALSFAYLYGINGIRVASGIADTTGKDTVTADLFNYYGSLQHDVIYRESMNAFVRGINMVFVHLGEDRTQISSDSDDASRNSIFSHGDDLTEYASFVSRVQSLLRGGEHVSEIAIVYPIHSLHTFPYLYDEKENGFAYPYVPENADYMELMNNYLNYIGMDAVFVHPLMLEENAKVDGDTISITNGDNQQKFKLLVMPSMSIISIKAIRFIKKFFENGGHILATDSLPKNAWANELVPGDVNSALKTETAFDIEISETIRYIFGEDVLNSKLYRSYYRNENPNGGIAYFLPSNKTSVDGTDTVSANMLYQATERMNLTPDVYIDKMPRREFLGVVNQNLPEFLKIGVDKRLAKACTMNCQHKKYAGCDIYYITNTTGDDYHGKILLRGYHLPEIWDPVTGEISQAKIQYVNFRNKLYTSVSSTIQSSSSIFIVSNAAEGNTASSLGINIDELPVFYPHENF